MEKLKQAHGNWVTGDRFWDREDEIAEVSRLIRDGANLLLVAQRRMGKTSLMKEISVRLANDFDCIFVDFQNASSPQDAIAELSLSLQPYKSLWARCRDLFVNVLDRIEKVGTNDVAITLRAGLASGNWMTKGDNLMTILAEAEKPVLLLLDEVPILVNRIIKGADYTITPERSMAANEFMSWLRKNSQRHQGRIRMLIAGSIGLEPVLRQAGLSGTINNFLPFELKPWDFDTAKGCLVALAKEYGITYHNDAETEIIRLLGCCIPHHVQMFFDHVRTHCVRKHSAGIGSKEVRDIYKSEMLSTRGHAELTHYEERLKLVLGIEKMPLALDMITEAAVVGSLTTPALERLRVEFTFDGEDTVNVQKDILWILEHDGYLHDNPEGYAFVSNLLRDWWKSRYKMFYTPLLKRGR